MVILSPAFISIEDEQVLAETSSLFQFTNTTFQGIIKCVYGGH